MSKLRIARSAVADLDEIWLCIAQKQSIETAERVVNLLTSKFAVLAAWPRIGRRRPELGPEIRSFPVQNYRTLLPPREAQRHADSLCPPCQA
jgi:toxin ParE1/3/4